MQVQLPSTVTAVASVLDSLVGALLAVLSVVQAALDVVKAFLPGTLDPIAAIVAGLISEVEQLLGDLREIGVFVSGDLNPQHPFDELLGGFQAYERRMVARLTDRADATRPDFSSGTTVVGVFLYESFAASDTREALAFIDRIKAFLSVDGAPQANPVPVGLEVSYGAATTGAGLFGVTSDAFSQNEVPSVANVRWRLAPPPGAGAVSWPLPAPAGFLVEVSTVPDGLTLTYVTPSPRAALDGEGQQTQSFGLILDPNGRPFRLYGGLDVLDEGDLAWSASGTTYTPPSVDSGGKLIPGKTQLYAYTSSADNVPVPLTALDAGVLQKTFFLDLATVLGTNLVAPGQPFSLNLRAEDMPHAATFANEVDGTVTVTVDPEPAREVYVRVSAVSKDFGAFPGSHPYTFLWSVSQSIITAGAATGQVRLSVLPNSAAKGEPSAPLRIAFPRPTGGAYADAVATAIAITVLSRSDLLAMGTEDVSFEIDTAGEPTGLEDVGRYVVPQVAGGSAVARFFKRAGPPQTFRSKLLARCRILADEFLARTGPPSPTLEALVVERATVSTPTGVKPLGQVLWSDLDPDLGAPVTILDSLDIEGGGSDVLWGIAVNPIEIGLDETSVLARMNAQSAFPIRFSRTPGFLTADAAAEFALQTPFERGSADYSPVLYDRTGVPPDVSMKFCRNIFLANPTVLTAANLVLQIAAAPVARSSRSGEGAWYAVRLFPQALPGPDSALTEILGFLASIQAGTKAVSATIEAYIDFLQARILELEALLQRIQALLDVTASINVPASSGLIVSGAGTDGVLQALLTAEDKPQDSAAVVSRIDASGNTVRSGTYGVGVVLMFGGLPTAAVDLLNLMFTEE